MLPNLSKLGHDNAVPSLKLKDPPAPTDDDGQRYFYIFHRPNDSNVPNPEKVAKIVDSGGVKPGNLQGYEWMTKEQRRMYIKNIPVHEQFNQFGIDKSIVQFLRTALDPYRVSDSRELKNLVAWFYLGNYDGKQILELASTGELAFRVPEDWLKQHAVSCVENPTFNDNDWSLKRSRPWGFLTTQIVPLQYRITSKEPLKDENMRVVSNMEIAKIIFDTHTTFQPKIRNKAYWKEQSEKEKQQEEARIEEEEQYLENQPIFNPFV